MAGKKTRLNDKVETSVPERQAGLRRLPLSLKVLFTVLILSTIASLLSLWSVPFVVFGLVLYGFESVVASGLLNFVGGLVLLVGMWRRLPWAWKYGVAYLGFFVLNGLVNLALLALRPLPEKQASFLLASVTIAVLLNVVLLLAFYRKRGYFE